MSLTVEETMCIVSVIQAVVAKLYKLNLHNMSFNNYRLALIKENKFRAARYGIEDMMILVFKRSGNTRSINRITRIRR
jgi:carboxylate-amine ligase